LGTLAKYFIFSSAQPVPIFKRLSKGLQVRLLGLIYYEPHILVTQVSPALLGTHPFILIYIDISDVQPYLAFIKITFQSAVQYKAQIDHPNLSKHTVQPPEKLS
jgi:hypothetical protein